MPTTNPLPTHPRTGLSALGVLPSGRIVWPIMGGDGTGDGGDGQGGNANAGDPGAGGDPASGGNGNAGQGEQPLGPDGQPLDPVRLQRLVDNLRAENTALKGKQQGTGQAPEPQQQAPDPAGQEPAPTDDGTAERLRAAETELAVFRAAAQHGADPGKLTDSRSFMERIARLDPSAEGHSKRLGEAIEKALTDHPHYAAGQVHGGGSRGGSDGTGRPGAPSAPADLTAALAAHYGGQTR